MSFTGSSTRVGPWSHAAQHGSVQPFVAYLYLLDVIPSLPAQRCLSDCYYRRPVWRQRLDDDAHELLESFFQCAVKMSR